MLLDSHGIHCERVEMILWRYRIDTYMIHDRDTSEQEVARFSQERLMLPPRFLSEGRQDVVIR